MSNKPHTVATLLAKCIEEGDCLLWQGRVSHHGVPMVRHAGQHTSVRRAMWQLQGRAPLGRQVVSNVCGNPLCCAPDHLRSMLQSELMRRRNRAGKGEMLRIARMTAAIRAKAKIDMATANAIRISDRPAAELAREAGLSVGMVNQIRRGQKWRAGSPMGALLALAR